MNHRTIPPTGPSEVDKLERVTLWSCASQYLFGSTPSKSTSRYALKPLSYDEACETLHEVTRKTDRRSAVPGLARKGVAQMLAAGHRFDRHDPRVRELFCKGRLPPGEADAEPKDEYTPAEFDEAYPYLLRYSRMQYGRERRFLPRNLSLASLAPQTLEGEAISEPIQITYNGDAYEVTKRALLPCRAASLRDVVDPEGWSQLGPFFEKLQALVTGEGPGFWRGELEETFVVNWNWLVLDRYEVLLKVEYTETDDVIRCDYSLMYEKDDQLLCDDGVLDVRKVPGLNGWCLYSGQKSLKFASPLLNMIAPGVLFMGLEREALGIEALAMGRSNEILAPGGAGEQRLLVGLGGPRIVPSAPRRARR